MKLAIIPARGGSKRIPRKNIKLFCGKPMIAWSIEAALSSGCFDRIIVSTDDAEISSIAKEYGAEVPFVRPANLSDDHIGTIPVIAHAIEWQNQHGDIVTEACCIYATAPFIQAIDLQRGLEVLLSKGVEYVFPVTTFTSPIQRAMRITKGNRVEMFQPEYYDTRSQDLEEAWHDAGQFYWGISNAWLQGTSVFKLHSIPLTIPRWRVQDIDTLEDWRRAELLFKSLVDLG